MNWALRVENLSKQYRIGTAVTPAFGSARQILTQKFSRFLKQMRGKKELSNPSVQNETRNTNLVLTPEQQEGCSQDFFWALRDISFEIKEGERVGIIGKNGSGKSTLLKILSRITTPSCGEFSFRGRLISLLEVGTGFHADLSGRENIFLNAKINGMSTKAIKQIFSEIVDFSELGPQIDTPIKRYSSGMYMRLAFSVAAHLQSEILIVDEVLAVGDTGFQKKCLDKMLEISGKGRTLLFVSHDMNAISTLCTKALTISHGRIVSEVNTLSNPSIDNGNLILPENSLHTEKQSLNTVTTAIADYVLNGSIQSERFWNIQDAPKFETGSVLLKKISILEKNGNCSNTFDVTDEIRICVEFDVTVNKIEISTHLYLKTMTGQSLLMTINNENNLHINNLYSSGEYKQICIIPANFLNVGGYRVEIMLSSTQSEASKIRVPDVVSFTISDSKKPESIQGDWVKEWSSYSIRTKLSWSVSYKAHSLPVMISDNSENLQDLSKTFN